MFKQSIWQLENMIEQLEQGNISLENTKQEIYTCETGEINGYKK